MLSFIIANRKFIILCIVCYFVGSYLSQWSRKAKKVIEPMLGAILAAFLIMQLL